MSNDNREIEFDADTDIVLNALMNILIGKGMLSAGEIAGAVKTLQQQQQQEEQQNKKKSKNKKNKK